MMWTCFSDTPLVQRSLRTLTGTGLLLIICMRPWTLSTKQSPLRISLFERLTISPSLSSRLNSIYVGSPL